MLANFTDITVLLDASVSMQSVKTETLQSLVAFIKEQQAVPGDANLTLVEFDSPGHIRYASTNQPIKSFNLDGLKYNPHGSSTALRDAWLEVMRQRGKYFASLKESSRPGKVIFVVLTDGQDNASYSNKRQVKEAVDTQRVKYNWAFTYLGANQDAELEAEEQGIGKDFAMTYTMNNLAYASKSMSDTVSSYRESGLLRSYTAVEKLSAVQPDSAKGAFTVDSKVQPYRTDTFVVDTPKGNE